MLDLILGISLLLIGLLILILHIENHIEGFSLNKEDENQSLQSANIQSIILAISLIIIGFIIIVRI